MIRSRYPALALACLAWAGVALLLYASREERLHPTRIPGGGGFFGVEIGPGWTDREMELWLGYYGTFAVAGLATALAVRSLKRVAVVAAVALPACAAAVASVVLYWPPVTLAYAYFGDDYPQRPWPFHLVDAGGKAKRLDDERQMRILEDFATTGVSARRVYDELVRGRQRQLYVYPPGSHVTLAGRGNLGFNVWTGGYHDVVRLIVAPSERAAEETALEQRRRERCGARPIELLEVEQRSNLVAVTLLCDAAADDHPFDFDRNREVVGAVLRALGSGA